MIKLIAAVGMGHEIGKDNQLLWKMPADLKYFKEMTQGNTVVMGRKTYESIGKPLPNRTNVILTRNRDYQVEGCLSVHGVDYVVNNMLGDIYIIGGEEIYKQFLPHADEIYLTQIYETFPEADAFFPQLTSEWTIASRDYYKRDKKHAYDYAFITLEKKQD